MGNNGNDNFDEIPVKNRCQYLLFKHLILAEHPPTTYELMKYGRTLDMCAPFGMTYNSVRRLVDYWYGLDLIDPVPPYEWSDIKLLKKKRKGIEMLERLRCLFDDPT